jgi:hypothetical protein
VHGGVNQHLEAGHNVAERGLRILSYVCDGRTGARPELEDSIRAGIEQGADVISAQGNGMDMGPFFLGAGEAGAPPVKQNFEVAVMGAKEAHIPFVFSLGGRAGADAQLEVYLRVFDEIARDKGITIRAAVISGQISKEYLRAKLDAGIEMPRLFDTPRLSPFLSATDIDDAEVIQAQMGPEPIIAALKLYEAGEIDGVLTGRAVDSGVQMAYPLFRGYPTAGSAHMAKIVECGSMCCDPPNAFYAVMAELDHDGTVRVWPTRPEYRCTVRSVAGHAVYERENPYQEKNPGGTLDVSEAMYEQVDDRTVSVYGATWDRNPYTVKLEGVKSLGYETTFVAIANDPALIASLPALIDQATEATSLAVVGAGVASRTPWVSARYPPDPPRRLSLPRRSPLSCVWWHRRRTLLSTSRRRCASGCSLEISRGGPPPLEIWPSRWRAPFSSKGRRMSSMSGTSCHLTIRPSRFPSRSSSFREASVP